MTKREASRETLERLAEAVDSHKLLWMHANKSAAWEDLSDALSAYRAEITPPLRTRAEVDAEIAATIRKDRLASRGLGMSHNTLCALDRLCAEPTAPEEK